MSEKLFSIQVKLAPDTATQTGEFTGLASTFGGEPDLAGDVILPGAFKTALKKHARNNTKPALLWNHKTDEPIGRWIDLREDSEGLQVRGKLNLDIQRARDCYALLEDGALSLSIGFSLAASGAHQKNGIRYIEQVETLYEISAVALPANHNARILEYKKPETIRDFERSLRDTLGFSSLEAKRLVTEGWNGLVNVRNEKSELNQILNKIEKLQQSIGQ